jgi:hypothetical protein
MDLARSPKAMWPRTGCQLGGIRLAQGVHTRGDADSVDESAGNNDNRECEDGGEDEDDEGADNDEDGDVEGADNDEKENVDEGVDNDEDGDVEGADNDEKENVNEGEGMVLMLSFNLIL